jgi:5'-3' exoribonuclease 2
MMQEVLEEMRSLGIQPPASSGGSWDSNVITPGTEFMHRFGLCTSQLQSTRVSNQPSVYRLSSYIWFYVLDRMNKNPAWRNIKVIFSDASIPGEGEHKIMGFIRGERSQPDFNPNQKHILHGLDADLIMLALATHEAHFSILREEVLFTYKNKGDEGGAKSTAQRMLDGPLGAAVSALKPDDEWVYTKRLQVARIHVLREYLAGEFKCLETVLPFEYDFERVVDDFVFMCFFVGNDFLPHLPSMDIRDGAIDFLLLCYKDLLPSLGGYLTSPGGNVNLRNVDVILSKVGEVEDEVSENTHLYNHCVFYNTHFYHYRCFAGKRMPSS